MAKLYGARPGNPLWAAGDWAFTLAALERAPSALDGAGETNRHHHNHKPFLSTR